VTGRIEAVRQLATALADPSNAAATFDAVLADDVSSTSPMGQAAGKAAVIEGFANPRLAPLLATATWSDPAEDGDTVTATATAAPGSVFGGIAYTFSFAGDRISAIAQRILPAPPPPPSPLKLTAELAEIVDNAFANGTPVLLAYVDADGQAHLSPRGTTQVFSADQLATWARDPEGGLVRALPANPRLTFFYRDGATRTTLQFFGRGHVVTDEASRTQIYDRSPEIERNFDPDRRGIAIVVDVDKLEGTFQNARLNMVRGA
jgi:pyridoxamine 5'-phosphate oxidase-like protein